MAAYPCCTRWLCFCRCLQSDDRGQSYDFVHRVCAAWSWHHDYLDRTPPPPLLLCEVDTTLLLRLLLCCYMYIGGAIVADRLECSSTYLPAAVDCLLVLILMIAHHIYEYSWSLWIVLYICHENVSSEFDRSNGWYSTLQSCVIRRVRLLYHVYFNMMKAGSSLSRQVHSVPNAHALLRDKSPEFLHTCFICLCRTVHEWGFSFLFFSPDSFFFKRPHISGERYKIVHGSAGGYKTRVHNFRVFHLSKNGVDI